jgi:hypothetical protein
MTDWFLVIWLGSAITFVVGERLLAWQNSEVLIWDTDDLWTSGAAYSFLLIFSPLVIIYGVCVGGYHWSTVAWRGLFGRPTWLDGSQDSVLVRLVKRRKKYDSSLKDENINDWHMALFWGTPEDLIFDITKKHATLKADGLSEQQIWPRLEAHRAEYGTKELPLSPSLADYIKYRLDIENPKYAAFGDVLLEQQIKDCQAVINHETSEPWQVPTEALQKQLSNIEVEQIVNEVPEYVTVDSRQLQDLKFRMSEGDKVWSYNLPPTEGIALVRGGKATADAITVYYRQCK